MALTLVDRVVGGGGGVVLVVEVAVGAGAQEEDTRVSRLQARGGE